MKEIDLADLIEDVLWKFSLNRTGTRPTVFATIPPELPHICIDATQFSQKWDLLIPVLGKATVTFSLDLSQEDLDPELNPKITWPSWLANRQPLN